MSLSDDDNVFAFHFLSTGTGLMCHFLHQRGYQNFDALDPSAEMLQVAKSRNIYDKFYQNFVGGGAQLPYEKVLYDNSLHVYFSACVTNCVGLPV